MTLSFMIRGKLKAIIVHYVLHGWIPNPTAYVQSEDMEAASIPHSFNIFGILI